MYPVIIFLLLMFGFTDPLAGQSPAWAAAPDTVLVDSAVLVVENEIVGDYAYYVVTDSAGILTKYVVLTERKIAEICAKLSPNQQAPTPTVWKRKFLDAPDSLIRKGK